jgi:hypothetical protein
VSTEYFDGARLCFLHEDGDDHWVPAEDLVGIIPSVAGRPAPELGLSQAALECAERNGVEPERIVEWDPTRVVGGGR